MRGRDRTRESERERERECVCVCVHSGSLCESDFSSVRESESESQLT